MWILGSGADAVVLERGGVHPSRIRTSARRNRTETYVSGQRHPQVETRNGSSMVTMSGRTMPSAPNARGNLALNVLSRIERMRDDGIKFPLFENGRRLGRAGALWEVMDIAMDRQRIMTLDVFTRPGSAEADTRALVIDWTLELGRVE